MDSYVICATPRTGSTLLCELLASTGTAGAPDSFFMSDLDPIWREHWGLPIQGSMSNSEYTTTYLKAAIKAGRGGSSVFGLRLMRKDLDGLLELVAAAFPGLQSDRERLRAAFGQVLYVHLTRQDKLAQAVSMVKAEQTGLWHAASDGSELERLGPPAEPEYDFDRIASKVAELERYDAQWLEWFDEQGIEPLRICYERLAAAPFEAVWRICSELGLSEPSSETLKPQVAKLSDAITSDWMRRYRQDLRSGAPG